MQDGARAERAVEPESDFDLDTLEGRTAWAAHRLDSGEADSTEL